MSYTITKGTKLSYTEKNKITTVQGYAFIDQEGKCFCIVYGEGRRDMMKKSLGI